MENTISSRSGRNIPGGLAELSPNESNASGVSWSAVLAGGFVTAALSLILLSLGAGLGLSSISLRSNVAASATTVTAGAIVWLILMEIMSSSMGGYLAGRLRTKWTNIHGDEVYFRDTAHGFLAWAVALVASAAFLASAATYMMGSSESSSDRTASATSTQSGANQFGANEYFVDMLFRASNPPPQNELAQSRREAGIIFANALKQTDFPAQDKAYLDQLVIARTGLSASDVDKRVSDVFASAKLAAETSRKTIAHSLLWGFLALLVGAFCASFAATIGGRQRDHVVVI